MLESLAAAPFAPSPTPALALALAAAASTAGLCAWACARAAARIGWVDAPDGVDAARKLQPRPVPLVGGAAILLGLAAGVAAGRWAQGSGGGDAWGGGLGAGLVCASPALAALALVAAFLAGLVDDLAPRGVPPGKKLALQSLAALPLVVPLVLAGLDAEQLGRAALVLGVVLAALNAVNTFDNADGSAASLGVLALAGPLPLGAAALAGFLPFNVDGARRVPTCYLGDSGSHLLGMLIALTPSAWPALALPLIDLARLSLERVRRDSRPWIGDRAHLAHLLEARGLARGPVLALLLVVAAPAVLLGGLAIERGLASLLAVGLGATTAAYALVLRSARRAPAQ